MPLGPCKVRDDNLIPNNRPRLNIADPVLISTFCRARCLIYYYQGKE